MAARVKSLFERMSAAQRPARPVGDRMADAKAVLLGRKRTPRVFFLNSADFAEFEATDPPIIRAAFHIGGRPEILEVLSFEGIAVRRSASKREDYQSRLFCCLGTGCQVPSV